MSLPLYKAHPITAASILCISVGGLIKSLNPFHFNFFLLHYSLPTSASFSHLKISNLSSYGDILSSLLEESPNLLWFYFLLILNLCVILHPNDTVLLKVNRTSHCCISLSNPNSTPTRTDSWIIPSFSELNSSLASPNPSISIVTVSSSSSPTHSLHTYSSSSSILSPWNHKAKTLLAHWGQKGTLNEWWGQLRPVSK